MTIQAEPRSLLKILDDGARESTQRLAKLSGEPWSVHVVSADSGGGRKFLSILARDRRDHYGVFMSTAGERYLAIFSAESCRAVAKSFLRHCGSRAPIYDETEAVAEIANIIVNSLSSAIADFQGSLQLTTSPRPCWGKKAELFTRAFGSQPTDVEDMTSVLIHISSPSLSSDCTLLIQLDRVSVLFLLNEPPAF